MYNAQGTEDGAEDTKGGTEDIESTSNTEDLEDPREAPDNHKN